MNRHTLRQILKWSLPVNLVLFVLAYADYSLWESRGMITILAVYAVFVLGLITLLMLGDGPRFRRIEFNAPKEGAKTIIYRRP